MSLRNIRRIFIMTLEATPHRKWGSIGALDARGFPMKNVHVIHGIDGVEYRDHDALIKDAVADGFGFFAENPDFLEIPVPMAAGTWSACRMLRHIKEQRLIALLMEDDWIFNIDYDEIQKRLRTVDDEETQIAALMAKVFYGKSLNRSVEPINEHWVKGVPGSAAGATIYKPEGAKLVLKQFKAGKARTLEKAVTYIEYPQAVTILAPIARHPALMGYSRANPKNNRQGYIDAYEKWHRGTTLSEVSDHNNRDRTPSR